MFHFLKSKTLSRTVTRSFCIIACSLILLAHEGYAQGQIISGTITDSDTKEQLAGVTVIIPKLKIGAKTDSKGAYKITNAPAGTHLVEARLVGYQSSTKSITVEAGGTATLDLSIAAKALQQDEVVVVGLSGEVDRKKLGNAIAEVSGAQIAEASTSAAIDALSGRVAGLVVNKPSGTPGAGTYITIRGRKTISGSSEPLYVVDGVIIDNSSVQDNHFQGGAIQLGNRAIDISADNIEKIEVLKGPSASAIYGSLAGNGVVLITTKHAKAVYGDGGKNSTITFSTSIESGENAGRASSEILQTKYGRLPGTNRSWGPLLDTLSPKPAVYDHIGEILKPRISNEQSLSITGGAPEFSYFLAGNRSDMNGLIANSNYLKQDVRANIQLIPFSALTIKSNSNFIDINNPLPQDGSNRSGLLLGAMRTPPEFNNTLVYNPDGSQHKYASYDNPLWSVENNHFLTTVQRFIHSTEASLNPVDWLVMTGRIGLDKYSQFNSERLAVTSAASTGLQGTIDQQRFESSSLNLDFNAIANFKPIEDFSEQFVVGGQTIWSSSSNTGATSTSTIPFYDQISAGNTKDAASSSARSKLVGFFGQLTSTYLDRYTLTLAVRRDGSSTFGSAKQFHTYPKASVALQLPVEDIEATKDILSSVKLRGGYGEAGSPSLPGAYSTNLLYSVYGNNDGWVRNTSAGRAGFTGFRQAGGDYNSLFVLGNPSNISPEISIEREIGIDIGLFSNRVNIEATFYHTNVNDLILNIPTPGSSGYDKKLVNAGSMWNEGVEFAITALPFNSSDFSWKTSFIYSRNYNLVTSLSGVNYVDIYGFQDVQNVAIVGRPLGVFYGLGYLRDATGKILYSTQDPATDYFGLNVSGAPQVDPNLQVVGDPNPQFAMSWRNEFTILKKLNFSFLFDGVFGQDVWNGTKGALNNFGKTKESEDRDQPWFFDGHPVIDNATGKQVNRDVYYQTYANTFTSLIEPNVEKGSYIKLREVSLSYDWDGLKEYYINNIRFSVSARNLFTISNYTGLDPEVNNFAQSEARGFDYFNLPPIRTYRFGISLTY